MRVGGLITQVSEWQAVRLLLRGIYDSLLSENDRDKPKLLRCLSIEEAKKWKPQTQATTDTTMLQLAVLFHLATWQ